MFQVENMMLYKFEVYIFHLHLNIHEIYNLKSQDYFWNVVFIYNGSVDIDNHILKTLKKPG